MAANQEFGHFCDAIRLLPLQCRKAFILRKVYGYSQKEIASNLDISDVEDINYKSGRQLILRKENINFWITVQDDTSTFDQILSTFKFTN